jgi:D-alanyl-D-alanine carboxypeptidase/D-alanyl-D-alanine-endopeptidase (penicillin-binding protein 4)
MNRILPILCLFISCSSFASTVADFKQQMQAQLKRLPADTDVSFAAEVLGKNQTLFSHQEGKSLIPASATKLLVTVASLEGLGPGYTFTTKASVEGKVVGARLVGNLVLRGNGDPFLVSERLWLLARDVARTGITEITGGIRVDNGYFSEDSDDLLKWVDSGEKFATIVSATSFDFNNLEVHASVDLGKKRVNVETGPVPHDYALVKNQVKLVSGSSTNLTLSPSGRTKGQEVFVLSGTLGRDAPAQIEYAAVAQPASYIAHVFASMLKTEGIKVGKDFAGVGRNISVNETLAKLQSPPLMDLVRSLNTYSNNFMTEQIFQAWGATIEGEPASTVKSRAALKKYLERHGICQNIVVDNGSGLSWDTRIDAKCFVDLLQNSYRDFRVFADLLGSVPVGGSTGTLKHRFKGRSKDFDPLKVRAKTGTLWSVKPVTSLVGFTQTKSGETAVFAILLNNAKNKPALLQPMRDWEDTCVDLLQQLQL